MHGLTTQSLGRVYVLVRRRLGFSGGDSQLAIANICQLVSSIQQHQLAIQQMFSRGAALALSRRRMTLKIETASDGETATLRLSGQIDECHLAAIEAEVRRYRPRLVFDLSEATLVERVAVRFLAAREVEGVELRQCPRYIREWIHRELTDPEEKGL